MIPAPNKIDRFFLLKVALSVFISLFLAFSLVWFLIFSAKAENFCPGCRGRASVLMERVLRSIDPAFVPRENINLIAANILGSCAPPHSEGASGKKSEKTGAHLPGAEFPYGEWVQNPPSQNPASEFVLICSQPGLNPFVLIAWQNTAFRVDRFIGNQFFLQLDSGNLSFRSMRFSGELVLQPLNLEMHSNAEAEFNWERKSGEFRIILLKGDLNLKKVSLPGGRNATKPVEIFTHPQTTLSIDGTLVVKKGEKGGVLLPSGFNRRN